MVGWVLRLIVMYDPPKRKKWGRLTNERRMFRVLVSAYVLLEVGVWLAVWNYGMMRYEERLFGAREARHREPMPTERETKAA